jgi:kinesin family protein 18/19
MRELTQKRRLKDQQYAFDYLIKTAKRWTFMRTRLSFLLEGYNATVFAYGATGAGKTHTKSYY